MEKVRDIPAILFREFVGKPGAPALGIPLVSQ
jgi:hypothetical protein